jgi:RimJ/RimL family protein N-acetyltransferase
MRPTAGSSRRGARRRICPARRLAPTPSASSSQHAPIETYKPRASAARQAPSALLTGQRASPVPPRTRRCRTQWSASAIISASRLSRRRRQRRRRLPSCCRTSTPHRSKASGIALARYRLCRGATAFRDGCTPDRGRHLQRERRRPNCPRSKTDQEGEGQVIAVLHGSRLKLIAALRIWIEAAGITEGPIFLLAWSVPRRYAPNMLELSSFTIEQAPTLASWFGSESEVVQWGGPGVSFPLDRDQVQAMLIEELNSPPTRRCWAANCNGDMVGHAQIVFDWRNGNARLARVAISPQFQGRGLAAPMLRLVLDEAFACAEIERIELSVYSWNATAIRTYQRLGFVLEGTLRSSARVGSERWDTLVMSILRPEWRKSSTFQPLSQQG